MWRFLFATAAPFADASVMLLRLASLTLAAIRALTFTKELVGDDTVRLDDLLHDAVAVRGPFHLRHEPKGGDPQEEETDDGPESTGSGMTGMRWFHLIWWFWCISVCSALFGRLDRCATAAPPDRMQTVAKGYGVLRTLFRTALAGQASVMRYAWSGFPCLFSVE